MRKKCVRLGGFVLLSGIFLATGQAADPLTKTSFRNFVAVGDSLVAGFENFSLVAPQQVHSFAYLLAQQAGADMTLPLVPCPGVPNVLQLYPPLTAFPPNIMPVGGSLPYNFPRLNPFQQPTNLAVPGQTVADALYKVPNFTVPGTAVDQLTNVVLGFPQVFSPRPQFMSQVDTAISLQPKVVLVWLGNNDALFALLTGNPLLYTPPTNIQMNFPINFTTSYHMVLQKLLTRTGATLITANIPDITLTPFFTPAKKAEAILGIPLGTGPLAGVSTGDYLRPGALQVIAQMLRTGTVGPLPPQCPLNIQGLPFNQAPCVLKAADAEMGRAVINTYNQIIAAESAMAGATMVDIYSVMNNLAEFGYPLRGGVKLTLNFLGGLISLDGVHPSNTGQAVIANAFIDTINSRFGVDIPKVSVEQVAARDPLISPVTAIYNHVCPDQPSDSGFPRYPDPLH